MIVFFIGFMGSGKSHMASAVAKLLQVPCIDLDEEIEKKEGMTITEIFRSKGEQFFRELETSTLHEMVRHVENFSEKRTVVESRNIKNHNILATISCGGGTPCYHGNMEWMNEKGLAVWMAPLPEVLLQRLKGEKSKRPLIATMDDEALEKFVKEKLLEREEYYSKAKLSVTDPNYTPEQIINAILDTQDFL